MPMAIGGGIGPQVYRYIPDTAPQAADQLGLAVGWLLQVQATNGANGFSTAEIYLGDRPFTSGAHEGMILGTKGVEESATMVGKRLGQQLEYADDWGAAEFIAQINNPSGDTPISNSNWQLILHRISQQAGHTYGITDIEAQQY